MYLFRMNNTILPQSSPQQHSALPLVTKPLTTCPTAFQYLKSVALLLVNTNAMCLEETVLCICQHFLFLFSLAVEILRMSEWMGKEPKSHKGTDMSMSIVD